MQKLMNEDVGEVFLGDIVVGANVYVARDRSLVNRGNLKRRDCYGMNYVLIIQIISSD